MSDTELIDQSTPTPPATPTPTPESDVEQVVITVPAKLKRAVMATVEFVRSIFTGEIILNPSISKGYDYLFYLALLFLASIIFLFSSLHMQIRENRTVEQVRLLEERALRSEEQRLGATTHSAIVRELKRRDIPLEDTIEPVTIIKEEKKR
ncbi:MAG: hypothetical protein IJB23_02175 [Alistipes sp.]|nr:hypothetical protein [Alistipes sp.]MBQ7952277.1 hypothetical protein [Alistipes sp.]